MENSKAIGIGIVIGLLVALGFTIVYTGKTSGTTGAATAGSGMSTEEFSSYEEMMAAHHPGQAASAQSEDGCGGVASGTGAKASFAGTLSEYGLAYDDTGYQQLLTAAKNVQLTPAQTNLIVGLDIRIPCCEVTTLQATDNCECGHHVAMYGLAKLLASKGYERDTIQSELNKWKEVFYPGGGSGNTGGC